MTNPNKLQKPRYSWLRSWGWAWKILGVLVGAATIISLIRNLFTIDLYGLPAELHKQYSILRDWLFYPIAYLLKFLSLPFPAWLKDLIAAYAVPAAAIWRHGVLTGEDDRIWHQRDPERFRQMLREAARTSQIDPDDLIRRVEKGINKPWYFFYRQIRGGLLWPRVIRRQMREIFNDRTRRNARTHLFGFARELRLADAVVPEWQAALLSVARYCGLSGAQSALQAAIRR